MCGFQGRSQEKLRIPNKPIPEGFKRWALGDRGYFYTWAWHSKGEGPHCPHVVGLNPTASVVAYLASQLPLGPLNYHLFLDNLFTSEALCSYLYQVGIGCTGTARVKSGIHQDLLNFKKKPPKDISWGDRQTRVNATGKMLSVAWVDHEPVLFLTNASEALPQVQSLRRRPGETASWARLVREPFGDEPTKILPIPLMIDRYNHHMNGVDWGDQLRALGSVFRSDKGWKALFFDSIQLMLCNAYLLVKHSPSWDPKEWKDPTVFKRAVINALVNGGGDWGNGERGGMLINNGGSRPRRDWWSEAIEARPRYETRGQENQEIHVRVLMPRRACRVCKRNRGAVKRGLRYQRIPLGDLPVNAVPRVKTPASGCQACDVSLCARGNCWEVYHRGIRGETVE